MSSPMMTRMFGRAGVWASAEPTAASSPKIRPAMLAARAMLLRITLQLMSWLPRKDALPIALHADDHPGPLLRLVVERLSEGADRRSRQPLRRAVGVFAHRIVVQ